MDTIQVRRYMNLLPRDRLHNREVYASDRLPTHMLPSTAIVVNTVPHTEGGEHWVVFYWDEGDASTNRVEYFDSLGRPPYQTDYQQFMRRNSNCRFVYNKYRLQGFDTTVCGHYCLTYLYCRVCYGISMNDFVNIFNGSVASAENDAFVVQLFDVLYSNVSAKKKKNT